MDIQKTGRLMDAQSGIYDVCIWGAGFLGRQKGLELLRKRGISVDYYCDNNRLLWGKEIVDGIKCISPEELRTKENPVICFVMVTNYIAREIMIQLKEMGIERVVLFDDLFMEEKEEYFPFMKRNSIVFYTCIVGDYDELTEPFTVLPGCDYYIISDREPQRETVFKYMDIKECLPDGIVDPAKQNRYCKINAHKIFPGYRYSVYFDGQIQIDSAIKKYIRELPPIRLMAFCRNYWKSPYMEAMRVLLNKRDSEETVVRQMEKYWLEGLPEDFGNLYCGILIREHNHPVCRKLMEDWWEQIEQFSKRDQISFSYVLWKNGYTINDVKTVTESFGYEGEYWKLKKTHNRPRLVYDGRIIY